MYSGTLERAASGRRVGQVTEHPTQLHDRRQPRDRQPGEGGEPSSSNLPLELRLFLLATLVVPGDRRHHGLAPPPEERDGLSHSRHADTDDAPLGRRAERRPSRRQRRFVEIVRLRLGAGGGDPPGRLDTTVGQLPSVEVDDERLHTGRPDVDANETAFRHRACHLPRARVRGGEGHGPADGEPGAPSLLHASTTGRSKSARRIRAEILAPSGCCVNRLRAHRVGVATERRADSEGKHAQVAPEWAISRDLVLDEARRLAAHRSRGCRTAEPAGRCPTVMVSSTWGPVASAPESHDPGGIP